MNIKIIATVAVIAFGAGVGGTMAVKNHASTSSNEGSEIANQVPAQVTSVQVRADFKDDDSDIDITQCVMSGMRELHRSKEEAIQGCKKGMGVR